MRVEDYEFGRFLVESESHPGDWYLVDLLERCYGAEHSCDCDDFSIRVEAVFARGEIPNRTDCKHVREVVSRIPDCERVVFQLRAFEAKCERKPMKIGGRHG